MKRIELRRALNRAVFGLVALLSVPFAVAADDHHERQTRLFYQDHESQKLHWIDVLVGEKPAFGEAGVVDNFPELDPEKQNLVQMQQADRFLVVGVRDNERGDFQSGWLMIRTGVELHDHGDHEDWKYVGKPDVWQANLDDKQGNPAHMYLYDGLVYIANDSKNGYTRINPREYFVGRDGKRVLGKGTFHRGGGRHITLAVVDSLVGYSTWIDREGEKTGQVDVTLIRPFGNDEVAYSFHLPHGGLHGATTNQGKVFFAPSEGVYWVEADLDAKLSPEDVKAHHLSLGSDSDGKPLRTGAFSTHQNYVLLSTGAGEEAKICLIDAAAEAPEVQSLSIPMEEGNRPITPKAVTTSDKRQLAFVFHNHPADVDNDDFVTVIDLDPDKDGDYSDATILKTIQVGQSKVEGHFGHHSIAFDDDGKFAYYTEPGAGRITILSLSDLEPVAMLEVGGMPTSIAAHGGHESDH